MRLFRVPGRPGESTGRCLTRRTLVASCLLVLGLLFLVDLLLGSPSSGLVHFPGFLSSHDFGSIDPPTGTSNEFNNNSIPEISSSPLPSIDTSDIDTLVDASESPDLSPVQNPASKTSTPSTILVHTERRTVKHSTPSSGQDNRKKNFSNTPTKNENKDHVEEIKDTSVLERSSNPLPSIDTNDINTLVDASESPDLFTVHIPTSKISTPSTTLAHTEIRKAKHTTLSSKQDNRKKDFGNTSTKHENKNHVEEIKDTREGFAVWSRSCQIPDLDPWHPTILHLVSKTPPLDCSKDHPPISSTREVRDPLSNRTRTALHLDPDLASNLTDGRCCYQTMTRKDENNVNYGSECRPLDFGGDSVLLADEKEEFVRVQCWENQTKPVYTNFHASVPSKRVVEDRLASLPKASGTTYNVLILGLDAMSRLNAHRQVPRTLDYLKSQLGAVEMKGFQKVGDNTFPNLVPLFSGYSEDKLPEHCWGDLEKSYNDCPWVWNRFSSVGYRTLYGEDSSWMSTFNYVKPGFQFPPTDYYSRPYMKTLEKELGWNKALNCYRCLGPKSQVEVLLDWSKTFLHKFSARPYFGFVWMNSMSHDFLNSASAVDLLVLDFLRDLKEGGHLDNTVVLFMGDHGLRWGKIVETYVGRMEERLPLLTISLPQELKRQHPKWVQNLMYNSRRLVTPFDLHSTLLDLLPDHPNATFPVNGSWAKPEGPGLTLFAPLPANRTCEEAEVAGQWCTCQQSKKVATDDPEVLHVVEFVVEQLNHFLSVWPVCSPLKLDSVSSARIRSPLDHLKSEKTSADIFDYSATFKTLPGGAVLDATVRFVPHNHTHELLGEVARLNLYGHQSWCVHDAKARKYCYCFQQFNESTSRPPSR